MSSFLEELLSYRSYEENEIRLWIKYLVLYFFKDRSWSVGEDRCLQSATHIDRLLLS